MKLLIAGSRKLYFNVNNIQNILYLHNLHPTDPTEVVSGGAEGIDYSGEVYANYYGIKVVKFPADWDTHGKAAGYIRNKQMAEYSEALLLIWDGESRGSANMKKEMQKLGKPIYEVILKKENV